MNKQTNRVQLNTGSTKKLWMVVGSSVLLTALFIAMYFWQRSTVNTTGAAVETSNTVDTSTWQTYHADQGFSFKYPADWEVAKTDQQHLPRDGKTLAGYVVIPSYIASTPEVSFYVTSRSLAEEVAYRKQFNLLNPNLELVSSDAKIILGKNGHQLVFYHRLTEVTETIHLVNYAGTTLVIIPYYSGLDADFSKMGEAVVQTLTLP